MRNTIDPKVIMAAAKGDRQAFRQVVEAHQGFVYSVAFRFVNNGADAEEITQDVFVKLWKQLHTYRLDVKLTTWLYTIVTNTSLDFLKSRYGKELKQTTSLDKGKFLYAQNPTPEEEIQHVELNQIVHEVAAQLTPKQRAVFILRDLEGLTPQEVAKSLGMSLGNVKSNLFYARQKVIARLDVYYKCKQEPISNEL